MAKRIAVGPKKRSGFKCRVDGKLKIFRPGELLPEGIDVPGRFFRDKRAVWVEDEPVKKAHPKPIPKTEAKAPDLPVKSVNTGEKLTKRKRKKLKTVSIMVKHQLGNIINLLMILSALLVMET